MEIKKYQLKDIRLMEFFQVMLDIKSFLEKEDLPSLGLSDIKVVFDNALRKFDEAIKPIQKSPYTQKLQEVNSERSQLLFGITKYCEAYSKFPKKDVAEASKKILLNIKKYGRQFSKKSLQEKTGIINSLISDFKNEELSKAVQKIKAEEWISYLEEQNTIFSNIYNERTEEKGSMEIGKTQEARKEMNDAYTKLIKNINAQVTINGRQKYINLINTMNKVIQQALTR
ncbi:MAG: DUF6261 family protein [Capnocytophaga sp.]|nr:DUF6261 family protein [Capnocytophaga sp.]